MNKEKIKEFFLRIVAFSVGLIVVKLLFMK
jgi:hypothetical protein